MILSTSSDHRAAELLCAKALEHLIDATKFSDNFSSERDGSDKDNKHPIDDDIEKEELKRSAARIVDELEKRKQLDLAWAYFSIWIDVVKARYVQIWVSRSTVLTFTGCHGYRKEAKGTVQFVPQCRYCASEVETY